MTNCVWCGEEMNDAAINYTVGKLCHHCYWTWSNGYAANCKDSLTCNAPAEMVADIVAKSLTKRVNDALRGLKLQ